MTGKASYIDLMHRYVIWNKAREVPGLDRWEWRDDAHGRRIRFSDYGDRNSPYGWELDHYPVAKALGGSDHSDNLRPLHHYGNSSHGGTLSGLLSLGAEVNRRRTTGGLADLYSEQPKSAPPAAIAGLLGLGAELNRKPTPGGLFGLLSDRP